MYRLLIVDDEKQIREGLKLLLPWEEYGIEICGEAQNGKEALELMERLSAGYPDAFDERAGTGRADPRALSQL